MYFNAVIKVKRHIMSFKLKHLAVKNMLTMYQKYAIFDFFYETFSIFLHNLFS